MICHIIIPWSIILKNKTWITFKKKHTCCWPRPLSCKWPLTCGADPTCGKEAGNSYRAGHKNNKSTMLRWSKKVFNLELSFPGVWVRSSMMNTSTWRPGMLTCRCCCWFRSCWICCSASLFMFSFSSTAIIQIHTVLDKISVHETGWLALCYWTISY